MQPVGRPPPAGEGGEATVEAGVKVEQEGPGDHAMLRPRRRHQNLQPQRQRYQHFRQKLKCFVKAFNWLASTTADSG